MMKRALAVVLAAGFVVGSYATDARVAVMGRQGTPFFYRDEVTVFTNPADMSLYPNLIYGSFGWLDPTASDVQFTRKNLLPQDPFFGAMISHSFSDEENGPMLSVGAYMNRKDYMLERLINAGGAAEVDADGNTTKNNLVDPLGKFDIMFGYDIGNGLALGLGFYAAYQAEKVNTFLRNETALYKFTGGINYNIEQGLDLEASVNAGVTSGKYVPENLRYETSVTPWNLDSNGDGILGDGVVSDGDYFLRGDIRFFSAVPSINGSFVPQVSLEYIQLSGASITDLAGGVGLNMNIDRGFFWAGLQGVYTQTNYDGDGASDPSSIGARVSFGIERNIVWDWFLIRVGGQKEFRYVTLGGDKESRWEENPVHTGFDNDLVGLGFGINIDNRLRIDFVASEDLPYTMTNLISGAPYNLFNRVSATYRF